MKLNRSAKHAVDVRGERHAAEAADERADRVGGQLGPHQRDAHHARGELVLADGQPGPPEPAVADAQRHEDADRGERSTKMMNW